VPAMPSEDYTLGKHGARNCKMESGVRCDFLASRNRPFSEPLASKAKQTRDDRRRLQCWTWDMAENDSKGSARRRSHPSPDRRSFLMASVSTAAAPMLGRGSQADAATGQPPANVRKPTDLTLSINGREHHLAVDTRTSLLDLLREHFGLTGTKKGCDHGQCGACTVWIDGRRVLSCLTLAAVAQGHAITTIEGLARNGELHPMQQAFIDHDAFQCGYCTPGQIMSAIACVNEGHANSDADIREYMSGNLCRCAAYPNIVDAVKQARTVMKTASTE